MSWRSLVLELYPNAADPAELAATAERAYEGALADLPAVRCSPRAFLRTLLARIDKLPVIQSYTEIAIAAACAERDPKALELFEREYVSAAAQSLARMRFSPSEREDVLQRVRIKLLVPASPDELPLVASYAGTGKLRSLLRVITTREGLSHLRKTRPNANRDSEMEDLAEPFADPLVRELAQQSETAVKRGFELAIAALSARERNMLRLHFIDGVELGAVARIYRVHRVTASRWLADVRDRIQVSVRDHVQRELNLNDSEMDSVMRLARSQLAESVVRVLKNITPEPG